MIVSYFDESGTHDGSPITDFAGYVGPASEWERFEEKWRAFRDRQPAVRYYHASECVTGSGKIFSPISKADRERKHREAVAVISDSKILGFGCAVDPTRHKAFSYLMSVGDMKVMGEPKSAYDFCFQDTFLKLGSWAKATYPGEKVSIICDQQEELFPQILDSYHRLLRLPGKEWLADIFEDAPAPKNKRTTVQLQAADVLAYELNRELKRSPRCRPSPDEKSGMPCSPTPARKPLDTAVPFSGTTISPSGRLSEGRYPST